MIKIDPISLKGMQDLSDSLHNAVLDAVKETAEHLLELVDTNVRTGYDDPVRGYGGVWQEISDERRYTLRNAGLLPHPGLVAETELLIASLEMRELEPSVFKVSIGQGLKYAFVHEFGGGRGRVPARPYFNPAINYLKSQDTPKNIITDCVKQAVAEANS